MGVISTSGSRRTWCRIGKSGVTILEAISRYVYIVLWPITILEVRYLRTVTSTVTQREGMFFRSQQCATHSSKVKVNRRRLSNEILLIGHSDSWKQIVGRYHKERFVILTGSSCVCTGTFTWRRPAFYKLWVIYFMVCRSGFNHVAATIPIICHWQLLACCPSPTRGVQRVRHSTVYFRSPTWR